MVDASCGGNFICKTDNEAQELFEHFSEVHNDMVSFSQFDVPRHVGG